MADRTLRMRLIAKDDASAKLRGLSSTVKSVGAAVVALGALQIGRRLISSIKETTREMLMMGMAFEQSMATVRALLTPVDADFKRLEKTALQLGRTTVFSATQSAKAMENFALAGFSVNEIMGAVRPTLDLAAAGTLSMADAARITADVMRGMQLETKDLNRAVDVIAKTATSSSQNVQDVGDAFRFVAPIASVLGVELEEVAASLGVLANRSIRSGEAGAGLRRVLGVLAGETEEGEEGIAKFNVQLRDAQGNFVGLTESFRRLAAAGFTADQALEIFGLRGGNLAAILVEATAEVDDLRQTLDDAGGTAKQVGKDKLNSLQGDVTLMTSAWEGFSQALFTQVNPAMRELVQWATDMINATTDSIDGTTGLRDAVFDLAIALGQAAEETVRYLDGLIDNSRIAQLIEFVSWLKELDQAAANVTTKPLQDAAIGTASFLAGASDQVLRFVGLTRNSGPVIQPFVDSLLGVNNSAEGIPSTLDVVGDSLGDFTARMIKAKEAAEKADEVFEQLGDGPVEPDPRPLQPKKIPLRIDPPEVQFEEVQELAENWGNVLDVFELYKDGLPEVADSMAPLIHIGEAIGMWADNAEEFFEKMEEGVFRVESVARSLNGVMKEQLVDNALALGDAMVAAATGAKVAWDRFLLDLIRQMISAIVKMLILQAIAKFVGIATGTGPVGEAATVAVGTQVTQRTAVDSASGLGLQPSTVPGGLQPVDGFNAIPQSGGLNLTIVSNGNLFTDQPSSNRTLRFIAEAAEEGVRRGYARRGA